MSKLIDNPSKPNLELENMIVSTKQSIKDAYGHFHGKASASIRIDLEVKLARQKEINAKLVKERDESLNQMVVDFTAVTKKRNRYKAALERIADAPIAASGWNDTYIHPLNIVALARKTLKDVRDGK